MTDSGFLVVDKPSGLTSHAVVALARRQLGTRQIGHTGTLDPLATGVLVLGVGRGTRLIEYHVGHDKEYEAELTFGATSTTYDAEGELTESADPMPFLREQLEQVLPTFTGQIQQVPPIYSAIKVAGKAAYARVRAGEQLELPARLVTIHSIELRKWAYPRVQLRVHCGSGTYIRSLAHDLGQRLGTGAYLSKLRRTRVGLFTLAQAVPAERIKAEQILPMETGLSLPRLGLTARECEQLRHGQCLPARAGGCGEQRQFAAFFGAELVAILACDYIKRRLKPEKVFL